MPTVNGVVTRSGDGSVITVVYADMANGDVGAPIDFPEWADRSVHVEGSPFGTNGTLEWQGSNDGSNYRALTDPQGNALDIQSNKVESISEMTNYQRPAVTDGDGTTSITAVVTCRRPQPLRA